jgi:Fe-S cluster assembly ATPase SufC
MKRLTVEERHDKIVDAYLGIPMDGSISVLTGSNGSGKSLIRGQLVFRDEMKDGKGKNGHKTLAHCSMSLRTENHGIGNIFSKDTPWNPTSLNTLHFIDCASNAINGGYLVLDEIEVGCSEETQMGLVDWLNENLAGRLVGTLGCLVITHSRSVVRNLKFKNWFNLDGYATPEDWCNREVVPVSVQQLKDDSLALFRYISAIKKED